MEALIPFECCPYNKRKFGHRGGHLPGLGGVDDAKTHS